MNLIANTVEIQPLPVYAAIVIYVVRSAFDTVARVRSGRNGHASQNRPCEVHEEKINSTNRRLDDYHTDTDKRIDQLSQQTQQNFERVFKLLDDLRK